MKDEDKWNTIHAYRRAVALDKAPAIKCPECEGELVPVVGRDGDPELKCMSCRIVFDIGLGVWDQIRANVHELYENVNRNDD
jgi:hypothetical protein